MVICYFFYISLNRNRSNVKNIYKWMRIGKDDRINLDRKDKSNTLKRKTKLINKTRSEYLKLYKK